MKRYKDKFFLQVFMIYTRYLLGGSFVFASIVKIQGKRFTHDSGAENPINSAWHFFETMYQSGLYWKFIGIGQMLAGLLLMTQRFKKIGVIIYLPIILNITIITYSYEFAYTPVITTSMLLATIMLIVWDYETYLVLFNVESQSLVGYKTFEDDIIWQITGIAIFLFTLMYRILNQEELLIWVSVCLLLGIVTFLAGFYRKKKLRLKVE